MSKRGDEPAYPEAGLSGLPNGDWLQGRPGMTLREHYAGLMMAAGLSALTDDSDPVTPAEAARCAIANADALLAALSKAQP
jgi:hypothetical protein